MEVLLKEHAWLVLSYEKLLMLIFIKENFNCLWNKVLHETNALKSVVKNRLSIDLVNISIEIA